MNFISALAFLGLIVAAAAQHPVPCQAPPLMSGGFSVMANNGAIMSSGKIQYDTLGGRIRVRHIGMEGNKTVVSDQLMLYNKKVYYEINWTKFSCKKKALDASLIPIQVPPTAKLMGQVIMGSSSSWGMGVLVNTWSGSLPGNGHYMAVFTETGCIPMTFTVYSPTSGWSTVSTFNWTLGLSEPMDFFPPFFCGKAQLEGSDEPDTVFSALASLAKENVE